MFLPLAGIAAVASLAAVAVGIRDPKRSHYYGRSAIEQLRDLPSDPWDSRRERLKVCLLGPNEEQVERLQNHRRRRSTLRQKWGSDARVRMGEVDCSIMRSSIRLQRYREELDDLARELLS